MSESDQLRVRLEGLESSIGQQKLLLARLDAELAQTEDRIQRTNATAAGIDVRFMEAIREHATLTERLEALQASSKEEKHSLDTPSLDPRAVFEGRARELLQLRELYDSEHNARLELDSEIQRSKFWKLPRPGFLLRGRRTWLFLRCRRIWLFLRGRRDLP